MTINCPLTKINFLEPVQMKIVQNILATFFYINQYHQEHLLLTIFPKGVGRGSSKVSIGIPYKIAHNMKGHGSKKTNKGVPLHLTVLSCEQSEQFCTCSSSFRKNIL